MRKITSLFITGLVFAGVALPVSAHVVVKPGQVEAGVSQVFTVFMPTEKEVPTTSVRLVIPDGISGVTPLAKAGWDITTRKTGEGEDAVITEITWSNGIVPAELKGDFSFTAKATGTVSSVIWKAYQTYQDGSVVAWEQDPATIPVGQEGNPYSQTLVVKAEVDAPTTVQTSQNAFALILSITALGISAVALFNSMQRKEE